jgi:hypothetical protein
MKTMGKGTRVRKAMGGKGTHYDSIVVGVIVIVAFLIVLFVYTQTIADMITATKEAFLSLFGL